MFFYWAEPQVASDKSSSHHGNSDHQVTKVPAINLYSVRDKSRRLAKSFQCFRVPARAYRVVTRQNAVAEYHMQMEWLTEWFDSGAAHDSCPEFENAVDVKQSFAPEDFFCFKHMFYPHLFIFILGLNTQCIMYLLKRMFILNHLGQPFV